MRLPVHSGYIIADPSTGLIVSKSRTIPAMLSRSLISLFVPGAYYRHAHLGDPLDISQLSTADKAKWDIACQWTEKAGHTLVKTQQK